jgi:hypothetical protein
VTLNLPRGRVWTSALYEVPEDFVPGDPLGRPIHLFRPTGAGWPGSLHTLADPFLFVHQHRLYVFLEAQQARRKGKIVAWSTPDLVRFDSLGTVLEADHHLSYPFVFEAEGGIYMIPESAEAGEVSLYRFADFPFRPEKVRVLLRGEYVDTALHREGGVYHLFTSSDAGLELFTLQDLLHDRPRPYGGGIITKDVARARCGGAPIRARSGLFRLAQNGSHGYGRGLAAWRINRLEEDDYRESLHCEEILGERRGWNAGGGHLMSLARFAGRNIVAVDGQAAEPLLPWLMKLPAKALFAGLRRAAPTSLLRTGLLKS